jgi:SAM-dependent methyltransferase
MQMTLPTRQQEITDYFESKFNQHGATPEGMDYRDTAAQAIRFDQLIKVLPDPQDKALERFSLNDFGCGYGGLYPYLQQKGYQHVAYHGYDVSPLFIAKAQEVIIGEKVQFSTLTHASQMSEADYSIACGVFNVKLETPADAWLAFILDALDGIAARSRKGFAFNALTKYSDPERMVDHLYYLDPGFIFDYCKRHHSKNVALLHDYQLYDFTVLVRK